MVVRKEHVTSDVCQTFTNEWYVFFFIYSILLIVIYFVGQHTTPANSQPLFTQDIEVPVGRPVGEIIFDTDTVEVEVGTTHPGDDPVTVPGTFVDENDDDDGQGEADPQVRMTNSQATRVCNQIMQVIQKQLEKTITESEPQTEPLVETSVGNEGDSFEDSIVEETITEETPASERVSPTCQTTRSGRVVKKPRMSIN